MGALGLKQERAGAKNVLKEVRNKKSLGAIKVQRAVQEASDSRCKKV